MQHKTDQSLKLILTVVFIASAVFDSKIALIYHFGNNTPISDQWDGEVYNLYRPFLNGTLKWQDFFSTHNEHHITTALPFWLVLLKVNKIWNPQMEMIFNSLVFTLMAVLLFWILSKVLINKCRKDYSLFFLVFFLFLLIFPYGWENILVGFQLQLLLAILFSILCFISIIYFGSYKFGWIIGIFLGLLAYLSFASGILTLCCVSLVFFLQFISSFLNLKNKHSPNSEPDAKKIVFLSLNKGLLLKWLVSLAALGYCIYLTPALEKHDQYKIHSFFELVKGIYSVFSWPWNRNVFNALFRTLPSIIFISYFFHKFRRFSKHPHYLFLFSLIVWSTSIMITLAYARFEMKFSSRYLDFYGINILINYVCLIWIFDRFYDFKKSSKKFLLWKKYLALFWALSIVISFALKWKDPYLQQIIHKQNISLFHEQVINNHLLLPQELMEKKMTEIFFNLGPQAIPYPSPQRLSMILSLPEIRSILPSNINPEGKKGEWDQFISVFLEHYYYFIYVSIVTALIYWLLFLKRWRLMFRRIFLF